MLNFGGVSASKQTPTQRQQKVHGHFSRRGATTALVAGEEVPLRDLTSRARHQRFLFNARVEFYQVLPSDL